MRKKNLTSLLGALAVVTAFGTASCAPAASSSSSVSSIDSTTSSVVTVPSTAKIALITDVGTIDDRSFNQGTWEGIKAFAAEHSLVENTNYKYFKPEGDETAGTEEYIAAIDLAVTWGAQIIVCPGYLFEEPIHAAQATYPNVKFVILDGAPHAGDYVTDIGDNSLSLMFREEESGFLAGYAAVMELYDDAAPTDLPTLGFMGGMPFPAVQRFGLGYVAGAYKAANVLDLDDFYFDDDNYSYLGTFAPDARIVTEAEAWYTRGVDVIFACAGGSGTSVMSAAANKDKWMIGVDVDQSAQSPTVLTSAMKGLGTATQLALNDFYFHDFSRGGTQYYLSVDNNGVGLPTESYLVEEATIDPWRFENFTKAEYEALYQDIIDGEIVPPGDYAELYAYVAVLGYTLLISGEQMTAAPATN